MAVETENVECLMGWLAEGGPARTHTGGDLLVERLAVLAFQDDRGWPDDPGRAVSHRDALRVWFAGDSAGESRFVEATRPDADPGAFIDWFLPVVLAREEQATRSQEGDAGDEPCWRNPNHDGTPGTEFYRIDPGTGGYLYAAGEDDEEWLAYEQRRYSEPARDEAYGLAYRYDRRDGTYEWYDEQSAGWRDQAWADARAAGTDGAASGASDRSEAAWDGNVRMFYRLGPDGAYEYADARSPGNGSSGCGEVWLSAEQARTRVMPVFLIPGWQDLEDETWARGWYTLPDTAGGYRYLYSPERTPGAGDEGWSAVPPAPPADPTPEQEEEYALLGFTLDEAVEAIRALSEALDAPGAPE
ncbi:hypothetical protein AB0D08_17725 [Kitasatospora sp. NPDC048540]|uniref:hypothetical protein n=1 Tax=unclassified Kitasatospora TaxID=2633591 RepID=UPI000539FEE2|nr:hypothetical protein [Kitasatospora sp. MBT63]